MPQRRARCSGFRAIWRDQSRAADDQAGLRPAEQLVAAEGHEVGAERDPLGDERLLRQAVPAQIDERAAAEILHDGHAVPSADRDELGQATSDEKPTIR